MCRLCDLTSIANREKWPKPLEPQIEEIKNLVITAHQEAKSLDVRESLQRQGAATPSTSDATGTTKLNNTPANGAAPTTQLNTAHSSRTSISYNSADAATKDEDLQAVRNSSLARAKASLTLTVTTLRALIDFIEQLREEWWTSDLKKQQRRQWSEDGRQDLLVGLNKVNNSAYERLEEMRARLGTFGKWRLGLEE